MSSRRCKRGGSPTLAAALLLVFLMLCMGATATPFSLGGRCLEGERSALLSLKAANPQAAEWLSSWSGDDCCSWSRVGCNNNTGNVIELHLGCPAEIDTTSCLQEVHPSLLGLTRLKHLDLSFNNFTTRPIPEFLGSLLNLEYLNLSFAGFTGTIPSHLGNLSSLRFLDLNNRFSSYYFRGYYLDVDDLQWLPRIPSLQYLDMSGNNLSRAVNWLHDINRLPSLKVLRLSAVGLSSTPNALSHVNFSSLVTLDLSDNFFNSTTPLWLFNLSSLANLDVSFCYFYGGLPTTLPLMPLVKLDLSGNLFGPAIPGWLFNISTLVHLDLTWNSFDGELPISKRASSHSGLQVLRIGYNNIVIPDALEKLSQLKVLELFGNGITGAIPETIGNLSHLEHLDLSMSQITGSVPESIGDLNLLEFLDLSSNGIKGEIPKSFGNLSNLEFLDLSGNRITGSIPETIGRLGKLQELYIFETLINGEIPETMGNLSNLQVLQMVNNNISGRIPETMGKLHLLQYLDLSNNSIDGEIPATLGSLCLLVVLDLSHNSIGGETTHLIEGMSKCARSKQLSENDTLSWRWSPPFIGDGLQSLSLGNNRLNGTVSESLGQLHGLYELNLASNSLTGAITEAHFTNLAYLSYLDLSYNYLKFNVSQGWIPPFSAVDVLNLCSCMLGPKFPAWLKTAAPSFRSLCLSEAEISDTTPAWFWQLNCTFGCYLNVSHNNLKGRLPTSLAGQQYAVFDVRANSFEGLLPKFNYSQLIVVDLSNNSFFGPIPSSFTAAMNLRSFALSDNQINQSIPSFFCQMINLEILDLSYNELAGRIPHCWNNSLLLEIIDLSHNSLSGGIPRSIGSLIQLKSLHLRNNHLSGGIPWSLKHCKSLITLDLGENNLSGSIPPWIGESLSSLRFLCLRSNLFVGSIPDQLSQHSSLQVLDLAHNNLSGGLPPTFGNFSQMAIFQNVDKQWLPGNLDSNVANGYAAAPSYSPSLLTNPPLYIESLLITAKGEEIEYAKILSLVTSIDLSSNSLSGEIPQELTILHGLHFMNLSNNHFIGRIPANIGAMGQLESLDLSNNNLSGTIPSNMSALNFLSHLDLSHNNLSGTIPTGKQFQTLDDPSIYSGNPGLCGWPLAKCHGDEPSQSPSNTSAQEQVEATEDKYEVIWLYAGSALGFVVGFWAFFGTLMIKRALRIAYFRSIDRLYDLVYVKLAINFKRLKSVLKKSNQDRG